MDYTYKCMNCFGLSYCDRNIHLDSEDCNKLRDKLLESRIKGVY